MRIILTGTLILVANLNFFTSSAFAAEVVPTDSVEMVPPVTAVPYAPTIVSPFWNYRGLPFKQELSLGLGDEHYLNEAPAGYSDYTQVYGRIRYQTDPTFQIMGAIDVGGSTAINVPKYTNYELPEAYANWEELDKSTPIRASVTVGRRKFAWNSLDSEWMLGLVQPFNRFDGLRPTEQGLIGAFASIGVGPFDLLAFGSGLYIPEQGAPFELTDRKTITTNSPWFDPPPTSMVFENSEERDVRYTLEIPDAADVVNHSSWGGLARLSDPSGEGYYVQYGFLRKPRNQISTPFRGKLCLEDNTNYGCVRVRPEVTYANVTMADAGYITKNWGLGVSWLMEDPDDVNRLQDFNYQVLDTMQMVSAFAEVRTFRSSYWGPRLRLSYLNTIEGGTSTLVGPLATNTNVFSARTMFRHALSFSANTLLYRSGIWAIDNSIRVIDEMDEDGTIMMIDFGIGAGRSWNLHLYADLLGSQKPLDQTDTFISRFRGNDRVGAIATYLF